MTLNWIDKRSQIQTLSKQTITEFIVEEFMCRHGISIQFGTGSLHRFLADYLIAKQTAAQESFDHTVFTNNADLYKRFELAQDENPLLFYNMQLQSSGGQRHRGLEAWHGQLAAQCVKSNAFNPNVSVLTAMGISFGNQDVKVSYKFDVELPTQVALATRRTAHRIVAADYTKVGEDADHVAAVTLADLVRGADRLTFVITRPTRKNESIDRKRFAKSIA